MIVWVLIIVLPSSNFRRWRRTAVLDRMWMDPVWMNTSWGNERNAIGWKKFCESSSLLVSWQVSDIIVFFGWKVLFLANGSMTRVENYHLKWTPWSCVGKRRMHNPKNPDLVFFFFFCICRRITENRNLPSFPPSSYPPWNFIPGILTSAFT